ncbi:MAG: integrase [Planctomycetaceae bacterium]|jgi:integrase/recombinase XerD|nr:integrase [Planctomycetaceae bacterium]
MPKTNRSGQALTLTPEQLDAIMAELNPIVRAALVTCRYTAARVTEALSLRWENVTPTDIVIPKAITKKKMKTRTIPLNPRLGKELADWKAQWAASYKRGPERTDYLFPGHKSFDVHLTRRNVDYALRAACKRLGIEGCSTHSFRRSALSAASDKGVPLRVIQSISGHSSLEMLQRYLDVKDEQKRAAALAFG